MFLRQTVQARRNPGQYRRAIERACIKADVPTWTPNQLRHNAARTVHHKYGVDVAGAVLGHALGSTITSVYSEKHMAAARQAAREIG